MPKTRLDQLLLSRGLCDSRSKAQALIMAGKVYSGEQKLDKPGHQLRDDVELTVREAEHPWVSRGGMKLDKAIKHYELHETVKGAICADIGSSTGGFTDVLLHYGAEKVFAVDVGTGQLDVKMRNHPRVSVHEKTNARDLTAEIITEPPSIIVCDASFISLTKVLPAIMGLAAETAQIIALIKPQFEVDKATVSRGKGVVRDVEIHERVCNEIREWMSETMAWHVHGVLESPITGPKGNKEFLLYAVKNATVR